MGNKKIKLNLGCGNNYLKEFINIDINKKVNADLYTDFTKKIPFKNNSVDEIYCKNLFEHVPNPLNFLIELKRILKPNGKAIIITSNASYLIYHFPRKKAYHDSYNLTSYKDDKHYFMFQKGHLKAFSDKAKLKTKKIDYHISNLSFSKDRLFQKILRIFVGKKFAYSDFIWVLEK